MAYRPTIIRSIQRGVISMAGSSNTASVAIAPVDFARSYVCLCGWNVVIDASGNSAYQAPLIILANSNTVTVYRHGPVDATTSVSFEVIEFHPSAVKSIQSLLITLTSGVLSASGAINAVNMAKANVAYQGSRYLSSAGTETAYGVIVDAVLTSPTVVTVARGRAESGDVQVAVTVVEFK